MGRVHSSTGKRAANYFAAGVLAVTSLAWVVFLGWGVWSLIGFVSHLL